MNEIEPQKVEIIKVAEVDGLERFVAPAGQIAIMKFTDGRNMAHDKYKDAFDDLTPEELNIVTITKGE